MRFSTHVAFILPLSALAATVFPVDKPAALGQMIQGINNATTAFSAALGVVTPGGSEFKTLSPIQANLAVIFQSTGMQRVNKTVNEGNDPALAEYVDPY